VELLTLSEVVEVTGQSGNFSVKVKKNPRYIDMDKCIACGLCAQKCPKRVDDEFNMGVSKRKPPTSSMVRRSLSNTLSMVISAFS
jgi:heterodisulfide reductase subunit A2